MADAERLAVERLLKFVNLGRVTDAQAVYGLLFDADMPSLQIKVERDGKLWWQPLYPQTGGVRAQDLETDRAQAQAMLEVFVSGKAAARKQYAAQISELVGKGLFAAVPRYDGHLSYELRFLSTGVEASSGFGLALLYDSARPFGKVLRRCAWAKCRKIGDTYYSRDWFLAFARGGGGPLPRYCKPEHQEAADKLRAVKRAKRWRDDHKDRRAK